MWSITTNESHHKTNDKCVIIEKEPADYTTSPNLIQEKIKDIGDRSFISPSYFGETVSKKCLNNNALMKEEFSKRKNEDLTQEPSGGFDASSKNGIAESSRTCSLKNGCLSTIKPAKVIIPETLKDPNIHHSSPIEESQDTNKRYSKKLHENNETDGKFSEEQEHHESQDASPRITTYICAICQKLYELKSQISVHMKRHNIARPYYCLICFSKFKSGRALKSHLTHHDGQKCSKSSLSIKAFNNKPLKTHTTELKYSCEKCKESFGSKWLVITHMQGHQDIFYHCLICLSKFKAKTDLKLHTTQVHN